MHRSICPHCSGTDIAPRDVRWMRPLQWYVAERCEDCGALLDEWGPASEDRCRAYLRAQREAESERPGFDDPEWTAFCLGDEDAA